MTIHCRCGGAWITAVLCLAAVLLAPLGGSAAGSARAEEHGAHPLAVAASAPTPAPGAAMQTPPELSAMREMRDKMAAARSPDERQALMAEHMKAMQDGLQMMKRTNSTPAPVTMGADMAKHHEMMMGRMDMMQTLTEMVMQRLPVSNTPSR
jgi:hypothetical protein